MNKLKPAFFLASSWFWCIGGFFPILLIKDFGKLAFAPFFFFNVLGAGLFGFIFNAERRARFLKHFGVLSKLFSVVVSLYHVIFITWLSAMMNTPIPLIVYIMITTIFFVVRKRLFAISLALFVGTIALFIIALTQPNTTEVYVAPGMESYGHYVLPLALGFLLSPYFDLTFHRAYAESTNPRYTFFVGFGVLFTVFLVGMFFIAPKLSVWITTGKINTTTLVAFASILVLQGSFTTASHLRELENSEWLQRKSAIKLAGIVSFFIALNLIVKSFAPDYLFMTGDMIYRSILFIIGVIFPVILIFGGLNKQALIAIGFLAPCFTLGFFIGGSLIQFLSIGIFALTVMVFIVKPKGISSFYR